MANINDLITETRKITNPVVDTVSTARSPSGTTLACNSLSGWPTNTAVHFVTYKKTGAGAIDKTTQCEWKGIVSSTSINNLTLKSGTDVGNDVGDFVEMGPTAAYGQDLAAGLEVSHNVDGTMIANLPLTTPKITTSINDANGNEVIKTPATSSAVNEVTVTNAATGNAPQISATGGDTNIDLKLSGKGTGAVTINGNKPWQYLGSAQTTSNQSTSSSTFIQATNLSVTVTVPTWATKVRIKVFIDHFSAGGTAVPLASIWDGTVGSGTQLASSQAKIPSSDITVQMMPEALITAASGSKTYNVGILSQGSASTVTLNAASLSPAFIVVDCC